jgi:hypothetical protein
MSDPIENIRLGGRVTQRRDGTFVVTIQIAGLAKESDAAQISDLLQPLVTGAVADVLKKRGNVRGDYQPAKPN